MGVHDCGCHQLPDFSSLVPSLMLTERRNSLYCPRGQASQTQTSAESRTGLSCLCGQ